MDKGNTGGSAKAGVIVAIGLAIASALGYYGYRNRDKLKSSLTPTPTKEQEQKLNQTSQTSDPDLAGGSIVFGQPDSGVKDTPVITSGVVPAQGPVDTTGLSVTDIISLINQLAEQQGAQINETPLVDVKPQTVTVSTGDGVTTQTIYVAPDGKQYKSEQEVFDAYIKTAFNDKARAELQSGQGKSTLEALFAREFDRIDPTNFITKLPPNFPKAQANTAFLKRAQAIQPSLTVSNPGNSSNSRVPNFSRLTAVGADLSKVDLFGVQNPAFLGSIKSGQGKLTEAQRILVDQERLRIDPRNQTSTTRAEIERNKARAAAESKLRLARATELKVAGYDEARAKAFLASKGMVIHGSLSPETFAALERRFT